MQNRLHRDVLRQDLMVSTRRADTLDGGSFITQTSRAQATSAPPVWSRAFPGRPDQVRLARQYLAQVLEGSPVAEDAVLCLSELASNAVVHSRSRQPGGAFTVRAQLQSQHLRVEVCDQGGSWDSSGRLNAEDQNGRGLLIVGRLAARWGCEGHSESGWTVWFELDTRP